MCPIVSKSKQVPKPNLQAHCHHTQLLLDCRSIGSYFIYGRKNVIHTSPNSRADVEFVRSLTQVVGIPKFSIFPGKKRANRNSFGQKLRMEDVLLIYFEQIVSFFAIIYSNTNSIQLFCKKNSSLSWVIVRVSFLTFYPSPKMF